MQAVELEKPDLHDLEAFKHAREKKGTPECLADGSLYPSSQQAYDAYASAFHTLHGPDAGILDAPVDDVAVVMAGGGKPHGRYMILDGVIETTASISQLRTSCTSGSSGMSSRGQPRRASTIELQVRSFPFIFYRSYILALLR